MKANRRRFLGTIGLASMGAVAGSLVIDARGVVASELAASELEGQDIYITAVNTLDGSDLGGFYIDHRQHYPAFAIQSPKRGELIMRVAPYKERLVEVSVFTPNGELIHHSYSGVDTTLSFYGEGVSLVIGMAPSEGAVQAQ